MTDLCDVPGMKEWCEPKDIREWAGRMVSFRSAVLILIVAGVLVSELRFGWVEQIAGRYLLATNSRRPEYGAVWETGNKTAQARKTLEELVKVRLSSQREARGADSLNAISKKLTSEQGAMISASHFIDIYNRLSPRISRKILPPYQLLMLSSESEWERTYFEKSADGMGAYLLNTENRVLHHIRIDYNLLQEIELEAGTHANSLESLDNFTARSYLASDFFAALLTLDDEARKAALPEPFLLLREKGRLIKAGISDEVKDGYIELGFELETPQGRRIVIISGHEWAVWQLRERLEKLDFDPAAGVDETLKRSRP